MITERVGDVIRHRWLGLPAELLDRVAETMVRQIGVVPLEDLEQRIGGDAALGRRAFEDVFVSRVEGFQPSQ